MTEVTGKAPGSAGTGMPVHRPPLRWGVRRGSEPLVHASPMDMMRSIATFNETCVYR